MKLSFSTKGFEQLDVESVIALAKSNEFSGIELHDLEVLSLQKTDKRALIMLGKRMTESGLKVPCLDALTDIAGDEKEAYQEVITAVDCAYLVRAPYVRIHALKDIEKQAILDRVKTYVQYAKKYNVVLLMETVGLFSDTRYLREILSEISSDYLGALYDVQHPLRMNNEQPETTIKNLGSFIHHVHIRDSEMQGDAVKPRLIGEGTLPLDNVMEALRSINYDAFISLEWDVKWMPEMTDIDVILAHFIARMRLYQDLSRHKAPLYLNKQKTGQYIWKKDTLIDLTFSQVLDRMVENFPDHLAFKYTTLDYTRTYKQFKEDVDEFARALISLNVKAGSHVAVWATNLPEWYIAFWATVKVGAVLVSVNTAYKIHEAEYLFSQSDTHTIIMINGYRDADYEGIMKELCPEILTHKKGEPLHTKRLPCLRNIITIGFDMKGCLNFEEAKKRADYVPVEELRRYQLKVNKDDVCNMQYTSGTTGFPKGVMLTHYNIVNNGKCIGDRMDLSTADRLMIQVPMFHCFGMVLAMTATMTHGGTLYPLPYFSPRPALACVDKEKITAFHGVPTMFIAMLENEDFKKTDFSHMRTGIMAGSLCPVKVMQDVQDKMNMKEITIVYGQTEASPGCTMSETTDSLEVRVNTVGRALPEIECKIIDPENGRELPYNTVGEFVVRGYNIMKGYYKMPKETAETIDKEGWLHTGDLALQTEEGNFRITGRLKDMIIRGGENIYPKEIEEFIYTHNKVKDVQVIGVPDEQYGEEIMAVIILKENECMTEKEMKDYIMSHMARHKVPRYIEFVNKFPMNVAGKVLKYQMRDEAIKKLGLKSK